MFLKISSVEHLSGTKSSVNRRGGITKKMSKSFCVRKNSWGRFGVPGSFWYRKKCITNFGGFLSHSAKKVMREPSVFSEIPGFETFHT